MSSPLPPKPGPGRPGTPAPTQTGTGRPGAPTPPRPGRAITPVNVDRTVIESSSQQFADEPKTANEPIKLGPGLRIEQFELIREIGRGGMGQVFLARDNQLGRRVAMKFLAANSPRFTKRFKIEAQATAKCEHENIVRIYEVGEYLGLPFMALEYVEGATLRKVMGDKRIPVGRAMELIVPVAKALARAHKANIVHRDLKPDNIVVTAEGAVKVLDFGIAKLFDAPDEHGQRRRREPTPGTLLGATRSGAIVGTVPYMSPEQLGMDEVDHRSDLWAAGIILYEMLAAKHPLDPISQGRLFGAAAELDVPMPSLGDDVPGLPDRLVEIVARCLAKRKNDRYATADQLCADLEPLLPSRRGRSLKEDESPYPGLTAFQESDSDRFFGRSQDIAGVVTRLRDQPLVAVVGPSGVGKSSFVRAGLVPALKSSGDPWEVLIVRPGRYPLSALATMLESSRDSRDSEPIHTEDPASLLRTRPGMFGARLRSRARRKRTQILVFVDQHEELYTLVPDPAERMAFTACLTNAGDDPSGPLRVVVSMRSDFLDRAAEDRRFVGELARGLVFLQPPSRGGLEEALTQPLEKAGYTFESGVVPSMLEELEATPGSLPLLQFTAAKLWETRDRQRRVLTSAVYRAMGGVAGALATHADEVLAGLSAADQAIVRTIFQRLVTPERTRAIIDQSELSEISPDVERVIGHLVEARLLTVQTRGEGARAVELVHESLIKCWPTLARWLDENHEDAAYLAQIRAAAKQWDAKGRPKGLLWRDDAMQEARLWRSRYPRELPPREQDYLDAVIAEGTRAARRNRRIVVAIIAGLVVALALILNAQRTASTERDRARQQQRLAEQKEATIQNQLDEIHAKERAKVLAEQEKAAAERQKDAAERATDEAKEAEQRAIEAKRQAQEAEQSALEAKRRAEATKGQAAAEAAEAARLKQIEDERLAKRKHITTDLHVEDDKPDVKKLPAPKPKPKSITNELR